MGTRHDKQCKCCGKWEVETFNDDGPDSTHCPSCNDRMAERYREQQEWNYYHKDEP